MVVICGFAKLNYWGITVTIELMSFILANAVENPTRSTRSRCIAKLKILLAHHLTDRARPALGIGANLKVSVKAPP